MVIRRCTEALDPARDLTFRTIPNVEGRCIEIATSRNQMLFDRRLARKIALAILEIAGPEEELSSDQAQSEVLALVYSDNGILVGFEPYAPKRSIPEDREAWIAKVREDAGLPPSRLIDDRLLPDPVSHDAHG